MKNAISKINVKSIWTEKILFFLIKVLMVFAFTTSRNKGAVYINIALDNRNAFSVVHHLISEKTVKNPNLKKIVDLKVFTIKKIFAPLISIM